MFSFRTALQQYKEQSIKFWGDLDQHADPPNHNRHFCNMVVLICIGHGGLHSLCALVLLHFLYLLLLGIVVIIIPAAVYISD